MKLSTWVYCACMLMSGMAARAATEQWSVTSSNSPMVVMADGKGGCGIARMDDAAPPQGEILWVDDKGTVIFQKGVTNIMLGGVLDVTPTHILYADGSENGSNVVIHAVNSQQVDEALPTATDTINRAPGQYPFSPSRMDDKKGFFAVRSDTNTHEYSVVRFSDK